MKKMISILLVFIMLFMCSCFSVFAENTYEGDFYLSITGEEATVIVSWEEIWGAQSYEVTIDCSYEYRSEKGTVTTTSYLWEPGYDVTPNDKYEVTVYAYDANGGLVAKSGTVEVYLNPIFCDNFGIYGDVDYDNMSSIVDATYIQRYLANIESFDKLQKGTADVDSDANITTMDSTYIQRFCANIYDNCNMTGYSYMFGWMEYDIMYEKWWE